MGGAGAARRRQDPRPEPTTPVPSVQAPCRGFEPDDKVSAPTKGAPMSPTGKATELRFEPPRPGFWEQDPVHFPRPATRYWMETHPEPFLRGTSEFARSYGMMIDGLEMAYIHGF